MVFRARRPGCHGGGLVDRAAAVTPFLARIITAVRVVIAASCGSLHPRRRGSGAGESVGPGRKAGVESF